MRVVTAGSKNINQNLVAVLYIKHLSTHPLFMVKTNKTKVVQ